MASNTERTIEIDELPVLHECRACTLKNKRAGMKGAAARHVFRLVHLRTRVRVRVWGQPTKLHDVRWSRNGVPEMSLGGLPFVKCPACDSSDVGASVIVGRITEHECDARCTSAKGHQCECSCGGKNHGRDFEPVAG